jgi:putative transposase
MTIIHRKRYETPGEARFLTFSCYRRLPLFNNDKIKDAFVATLADARHRHGFELIAWVVMPEHVHLLLVPRLPEHPVSLVLQSLKHIFARQVIGRWTELDAPILPQITDEHGKRRFWQRGGGYDRNLVSAKQIEDKAEYIHRNPVTRGLVPQPTDWRWSSAGYYAGLGDGILPA